MIREEKTVIAVDIGASNGRLIAAVSDGEAFDLQEVHRFENEGISVGGRRYIDILHLYQEIVKGLQKARRAYGMIYGIAIDTWGVDFGVLDGEGELMHQPWFYRDSQTKGSLKEAEKRFGTRGLYKLTGVQDMWYNTVYQIMGVQQRKKGWFDRADCFLMLPDLLCYLLTGGKSLEYTAIATSQLFDLRTGSLSKKILDELGIRENIFPEIRMTGAVKGYLTKDVLEQAGFPTDAAIPVFAAPEHDSASAAFSVPAETEEYLFLSSGTWSILGTVIDKPVISEEVYDAGFSNEGAAYGQVKLVKTIMGMWHIQELRKSWEKRGYATDYGKLIDDAKKAEPFTRWIDVNDSSLEAPADMQEAINHFYEKTGQKRTEDRGILYRSVLESLGFQYRKAVGQLEQLTAHTYPEIYLIGGSVRDALFCQIIANATGKKVIAGPIEGTAIGNALVQLRSLGVIQNRREAARIIRESQAIETYLPCDEKIWREAYERFQSVI